MDFDDTPEEAAFRAEARAWLRANAPAPTDGAMSDTASMSVAEQDEHERALLARAAAWQHQLCDAGWAGITWPKEYGGRGGTSLQHTIFAEEAAAFAVPGSQLYYISIGMVGPTLIAHGSDEQKARHVPPILRGDEIWCQLFSEPGAGSDLAGLQTRARREGDGWVVNGQKVWTTGARLAEYGALLARTDGSVPKHAGISFFVLDMSTPGIEIRPLRQITGDSDFNEVFLTDVWVPDDAVVGAVNDGWRVANTMLLSERGTFGDRDTSDFDEVVALARSRGRLDDTAVRQELAKIYGRDQVLHLLRLESRTALSKGTSAPNIASASKLLAGVRGRQLARLALDLLGAEGLVAGPDGFEAGVWQDRFLRAPVTRIAGGTDEVQKNILGERFLGIPKEPRLDKGVAFDDAPKAWGTVDFAFSDEQEQLREVVRKYLATTSPETEVRRLMATDEGYDDAVWHDMAAQLGLQGIVIPEEYGGSGFGFLELSVILEEMGRALLCAPYFSTVVLAAQALLASGDADACTEHLPRIARGDLIATFAVPAGVADRSAITATAHGDHHVLDGVAEYVLDGCTADLVLVTATTDDGGSSLFAVSGANALGEEVLVRTSLQSLDPTRKLARLELRATPARLVGAPGAADTVVDVVLTKAAVALASEQVGVCQWGVATSAEYARTRVQFARPIGTFQAIKHKCVDMLLALEGAKALAYYAAWTVETDAPDLPVMSSLAKAECSEATLEVTTETLHVHGGIGFTWEHPAHLYLKRAQSSELLFGDPGHHRELVCRHLAL